MQNSTVLSRLIDLCAIDAEYYEISAVWKLK